MRRELYFNRTGLVLVLAVLLATGMYAIAAHTHGNANVFWLTLATGIVATAIFTAFSVLLTTNQFNGYLREVIERSMRRAISVLATELGNAIRDIHPQSSAYLPVQTYPASDEPGEQFNQDLNGSFASSASYTFQGITAHYNIARFAEHETRFEQVHIIVADPVRLDAVVNRLMNRLFGAGSGPQRAELAREKRAEVAGDIWTSVVGAHQCWQKADRIGFCFLPDPPVDRAEIFDDEMFLSRFSDPGSRSAEFPVTCRFPKRAMAYQMLARDCARLFTSPYVVRIEIPRDDRPESLIRVLRDAGLPFSEVQYAHYKEKFWGAVAKFPREMKP